MASRQDLIQSYQFAARRVVSAVVMRQTDPSEWPFRRLGGAGFGAVMVTVICLAAVAVYGLVFPGGKTSWKDGKTVIVEKETGSRYVWIDGRLHPVRNFASAVLLAGTTQITSTAHASLMGVRRGVELGIEGAPDTLPTDGQLVSPPWSLCSEPALDDSGKKITRTALMVGRRSVTGARPGARALLVRDSGDGDEYLVWHDHRYHITDPNTDRVALRLDQEVAVPVGDAWLKALPAGQDIAPMAVAGHGRSSTVAAGVKVGQVIVVQTQDRGRQYYLARAHDLLPVTELSAQLLLAQTKTPQPETMTPSQVSGMDRGTPPVATGYEPPTSRPDFVSTSTPEMTVCANYAEGSFAPRVLVDSATPPGGGTPTQHVGGDGESLADRVWVPPGHASVVESLESDTAKNGPMSLVTDDGMRYSIPSEDVLGMLGYTTDHIARLPASLLARVPEGPALDPDAARAALALEPDD